MQKVKLGDVCEIINGKNQKKVENNLGKYPIYGSGGVIGHADSYLCPESSVVIGRKGTIDRPIFVDTPFWNVDTAFGLVAKREFLLPKYLYYFCSNFDFTSLSTTVTIPSLTKANVLQIKMMLPILSEQKAIAEKLDKVSILIEKRKQQLSLLDTLVKSKFVDMFGKIDESLFVPLSKVGKISTGSTPSMRVLEYYEKREIPFIKPSDIELEVSRIYRGESAVDNRAKPICRLFGRGAVLVTCIGTIGKIGISEIEGTCNQQINFIEPYETIDSTFLAYAIERRKKQLIEMANAPVVPIINKSLFSTFRIPVTSPEGQKQFARFVEQTDKSKFRVKQSLDALELLKKSLMQKYFG